MVYRPRYYAEKVKVKQYWKKDEVRPKDRKRYENIGERYENI